MNVDSIILHLCQLFEKQGRTQRYEISKKLFQARMIEGTSVENHVLKMIEWIEKLTGLGIVLEDNLCVDLILQPLPDSFSYFIMNFNMSKFEVTLPELLNMLREAESAIKKEKSVLYIGETKKKRKANKILKKGNSKERPSKAKVAKKCLVKDKGQCFHYGQDGQWKRNCKDYLAEKAKQKLEEASGIFMISLHLSDFHNNTWVLDTGSVYHIYNLLQVLARHRRLPRGEMDLKMGNGARVATVTVGEEYALETAAYLLNKVPSKLIVSTPYEIWKGKKPDLKIVKIWGCPAHVRRHNLDKYQTDPGLEYWKAVKCILKYLRMTKDLLLVYGGGSLQVEGYTDSSFQSDIDDSKSNSVYVFTMNGGAVSWKSFKQDTTSDSTIEAEYIAAAEAAKKGVWMKKFIKDLGVVPSSVKPIPIYCDNNGVIAQAKEPMSHQKSKHVLRMFHLIREIIARKDIAIERVPSEDNIAYPLTKPLAQIIFERHRGLMGIKHISD
ncbi:hypothetical protein OPV22_002132 [Ensete ventricosum]|uniref:Reverse transcriptase Ty1/copia-type domain-containing protein n=1 Tax=Ensete ventricosum TaxID=4639 RepID=A0AAV8RX11_ENSVE|nr:hypothetical protein OPV22_002132 [Ensete ventricosum]